VVMRQHTFIRFACSVVWRGMSTCFTQNFTLKRCSTLTINMIPTETKNTIHFNQRLLPKCLLHDLEIVAVNGGESTSQYHTPLAVAKFTRKRKKKLSPVIV
jgi:hypothetical protein